MSRRVSRSIHPKADAVDIAKRVLGPGALVRLRSGDQQMVVRSILDRTAECVWLDRNGKDRQAEFPIAGLELARKE